MSETVRELPDPPATSSVGLRLARATFAYGIGGLLPKLVAFLLVPLYAIYLSPADFGLVDLVGTFGGFVTILMRLGVPGAVSRFYFDHREGPPLRDYVTTIAVFLNASSVGLGALALIVVAFAGDAILPGVPFWPFVVMAVASSVLSANTDLQRRLLQAREQATYSAVVSIASAVANIALALALVVGFRMAAEGLVLAGLIANLGFFFQAHHYLRADLKGSFNWQHLRQSLAYGSGILPSHVLGSLAPLATRSILAGTASLTAVGHFGIAARFVSPLEILVGAMGAAYSPVYFSLRTRSTGDALARVVDSRESPWLVAVLGTLGVATVGPPVVALAMPSSFAPAADLVPFLALGALAHMWSILATAELFWSKAPTKAALVSVIGIATSLALVVPLATWRGALGLAWAQILGDGATAIFATVLSQRSYRVPMSMSGWVTPVLVSAGVWFCIRWAATITGGSSFLLDLGAVPLAVTVLWLLGDRRLKGVLGVALDRLRDGRRR